MDSRRVVNQVVGSVAAAVLASAVSADTLYVDDNGPVGGDGLSWDTCCRFLQDALAIAVASAGTITEIRVAQGTYTADRDEANPEGAGDCFRAPGTPGCPDPGCEAAVCSELPYCCLVEWDEYCAEFALDLCGAWTFQLVNSVALRGGYAGLGAPDPDHRDIGLHETVLSGDLLGDDGPGFLNNDENSWHVTTGSGTDSTALLDGFTITAGNADGGESDGPHRRGGGMSNVSGSPTVTDCTFSGNQAKWGGGMRNIADSNPTLTNCTFIDNTAENSGGGMRNADSSPTVMSCTFIGNRSLNPSGGAAGMTNRNGNPTVTNCLFAGNAGLGGGAMTNWAAGNPTVTNCTFSGNAFYGMWSGNNSHPTASNCIFRDNVGGEISNSSDSTTTVSYSNVQGGYPGAGNTDADPLFAFIPEPDCDCCIPHETPGCVDPACEAVVCAADPYCCDVEWDGFCATAAAQLCGELCLSDLRDLHLSAASPCIDAGDNAAVPPDELDLNGDGDTTEPTPYDLDGSPRFHDDPGTPDTGNPDGVNPLVDMGAYEFQGTSPSCPWDCGGDNDNNIGVVDFLSLLAQWGGPGTCDFDGAGVGVTDFLELLAMWGPCP